MYSKIVNPKTGRKVNIYGKLGKSILMEYLNNSMSGGGATWSGGIWHPSLEEAGDSIDSGKGDPVVIYYSGLEAHILTLLEIVPDQNRINSRGMAIDLSKFLTEPNKKHGFNKSLNQSFTELNLDTLIVIGGLIKETFNHRVEHQESFVKKCPTHIKFIKNLLEAYKTALIRVRAKKSLRKIFTDSVTSIINRIKTSNSEDEDNLILEFEKLNIFDE